MDVCYKVLPDIGMVLVSAFTIYYGCRRSFARVKDAKDFVQLLTTKDMLWMTVQVCLLSIGLYALNALEISNTDGTLKHSDKNRLKKTPIGLNVSTAVMALVMYNHWFVVPLQLRCLFLKFKTCTRWFANKEYTIAMKKGPKQDKLDVWSFEFDRIDIATWIITTAFGIWYIVTKHWIGNNILAVMLAVHVIEILHFDSAATGIIGLGLLLVYNVVMVYGTDIMLTFVMAVDAPVKVLIPTDLFAKTFTVMGLGDIVLPGFFIAFFYRYDTSLGRRPWYFYIMMMAYSVGYFICNIVAITYNHGQPALLFLVPLCVITPLCQAIYCGELGHIMSYKILAEEEATNDDGEENKIDEETEKNK